MENISNVDVKINTVNIYNREKMEVTGVVEVLSSTETEIIARIFDQIMVIVGKGLRVSKLVPEEKFLCIVGNINGLKYESKVNKKSFLGKVFK
ncbi:MAG: hypothetical protein IJX17_07160 [Clostridia bacterium]|nr:hypothetical protein [Clostridia bacterium]